METAWNMSIKANKFINIVLNMPLDKAWLFTREKNPEQVDKYDIKSHEKYCQLWERQSG